MDISTKAEFPPCASYLREVYTSRDGVRTLHQAKISAMVAHQSFAEFAADFWVNAAYPQAQAHKQESYGFLPTVFEESGWVSRRDPSRPPQWGLWRRAEHSVHEITLMYLDLDNAAADRPFVTLDEMETTLKALGLSHILYTSFSHTSERHKVRAILPVSRSLDYDTAFLVFLWFNAMVCGGQLDEAIYDDGDFLYGPPFAGQQRQWLDGGSVDVDAVLALVDDLPDESLEPARRRCGADRSRRELTPAEITQMRAAMQDDTVRHGEVTITNPAVFNPDWLVDLHALCNAGSHRQTLITILTRVFVKSEHGLTFGELRHLQSELDAEWGFYCRVKYGDGELAADARSVLSFRSTKPLSTPTHQRQQAVKAALARKRRS